MGGALSESRPRPRALTRVTREQLAEWADRPGSLLAADVLRLLAEVWRLRAKVRYLERRNLDLEGGPFDRALAAADAEEPRS